MLVLKMVYEVEFAARTTDPAHLIHESAGIWDDRDDVHGDDRVKGIVRIGHVLRIHTMEADMHEPFTASSLTGLFEHLLGDVDTGDRDVPGVEWKGKTRAHTYLEYGTTGRELHPPDDCLPTGFED